jgi:hypothetical protein
MNIKPELIIDGLEFSVPFPRKYTWKFLKETKWPNGWRIPKASELIMLRDSYRDGTRDSNFYWADDSSGVNSSGVNSTTGDKTMFDTRYFKLRVRLVRRQWHDCDEPLCVANNLHDRSAARALGFLLE